jgi:hypothetical protein
MLIKDQRPQGIKFILKFQRNRTIILRDNWNANEIHYIRHDSKSCSGPTKLKAQLFFLCEKMRISQAQLAGIVSL